MRLGLPALALALAAGAARAAAPAESLRPEARPEAATTDGSPAVLAEAPVLGAPAAASGAPEATRDFLPAVPRDPPLIADGPPEPVLDGPAGLVRAELFVGALPPVPVVVDGWAGDQPAVRPGTGRVAEGPPSGRPRVRPSAPVDPVPILPPEPDAPPVYAPSDRPDVLPVGPQYSPLAVARAVLPSARPEGIVARAEEARMAAVRGQVCGDPRLQGEVIAPVRGGGGCGVEEAVLVRSVDGVRLSQAATVDCATAEAMLAWVVQGARPAVGSRGGGLAGFEIAGSYACRPRNNQAGARMSEHGRGRAVDISAVVMADGSQLVVARDWPDPALVGMHEAACGAFSTTLGPGSDGFHEDHLHFDTAQGRGPYCR